MSKPIKDDGSDLWRRARKVIPGGNMLLSKRPEMFLPEKWPTYFSRAKGCEVWDLSGRKYLDMSIMGIGTNLLGYGQAEVDDAVRNVVEMGNMSTLNCPEEVYLAERMIEIHPWADMVRFARTGGEADAIAVRIGRAASGRDTVAFCGYHGWSDWYLSANIDSEDNLSRHLLPGLSPVGVPEHLRGSSIPFQYNKFAELEKIVSENDIGVVVMEVQRNFPPEDDFLLKIREITRSNGIVLIFDECTSGFREEFGGLHKRYNVDPDIAVFGKAIGNGYACTAVVGSREVMEAAQSTFISSTFWTERIGTVAALTTLGVMETMRAWEIVPSIGQTIKTEWLALANEFNLEIEVKGIDSLPVLSIKGPNQREVKTLVTQEMLKKDILAGDLVCVCTEHTSIVLDRYFSALRDVFALVEQCHDGRNVSDLLDGPPCHDKFYRLN